MAIDYGLTVDMEGFNASMEEARQKARSARNKVNFLLLLSVKVNPKEAFVVPLVIPLSHYSLFVFLYFLITFFEMCMLLVLKSIEHPCSLFVFKFHGNCFSPRQFYHICFFLQSGGNSIAMDVNATAQLRKLGLASTDDSPKFLWPKVSYPLLSYTSILLVF